MQERFHNDPAKVKAVYGGNRSSKTEEGAEYVLSKMLAKPNQRWWLCAETFQDSVNVQQRKIWKLLPKHKIKYAKYTEVNGFVNRKFQLTNGSMGLFKSYDQKREAFQSDDLDGCIAKGTLISLADGSWKKIEDINKNDMVISMRNTLTSSSSKKYKNLLPLKVRDLRVNPVLWKKCTGVKNTIIFNCRGSKLQLTNDHRVFISGKGWEKAEDVVIGDKVYFPKIPSSVVDNVDEHEAYWLGLMIGDGYIHPKRFQFTCLNEDLISEAKMYLRKFKNARIRKQGDRQYYISQSPEFRQLFKKYGLIGTHAYDKFVPQDIFRSSDSVKKIFLRALLNCDGWIVNGCLGYASTSQRLAVDVFLLLTSLGYKARINKRLSVKKNWRDQWYVYVHKCDHVLRFLDEIGIVRTSKKLKKTRSECNRRMLKYKGRFSINIRSYRSRINTMQLAPISKIEQGGCVEVYDIKVDRDENFIANNICIHNCWNDEEVAYDIYKEQRMRLIDRDGELIFTMTSLKGVTDLIQELFEGYDVIESKYAEYVKQDLPRIVQKGQARFYLFWTTENPYINQKRTRHEISLMTKQEILSRIYGIPINLTGKIYMKFNRDVHVTPYEDVIELLSESTIYMVLDPHDRKPWAMGWYAAHKAGTIYCFDEYPDENFNDMLFDDKTYDDYVQVIQEKEQLIYDMCGKRVFKRFIDPNFGNKTVQLAERQGGQSKTTPKKELQSRNLKFHDSIDSLEAGHLKVREYIDYKVKDDEIIKQPGFLIADNCTNHIRHMSRYSRKDITTADGDVKDKVGVKEKYKDFADLVRYGLMGRMRYIVVKDYVKNRQKLY